MHSGIQFVRKRNVDASNMTPDDRNPFMAGGWLVEPALDCISMQGERKLVDPKTMDTLVLLKKHAGQIVSSDELIAEIWNNRPMGDNPVYNHISQLRKAFNDDRRNPEYIVTVPKRGYSLVAPITRPGTTASSTEAHRSSSPVSSGNHGRFRAGVMAGLFGLAAAFVFFAWRPGGTHGEDTIHGPVNSFAVMPFSSNIDPNGNIVATGNGIAEELSQQLSRLPALRVVEHESALSLSGEGLGADAIAERLQVDHLLMGTLHLDSGNLVLHGRMLNAHGEEVWNNSVTAPENEIFSLIEDIAQGVADYLSVDVEPGWILACGGTRNIEACQRYRMAQEHARARGENYKTQAISLLQEAIALDPGFAAAYAEMAGVYLARGDEIPWPEAVDQAEIAIQRALELNENLPEAYMAQGLALLVNRGGPCPPVCWEVGDHEEAEQYLRKAVSLKPENASAHSTLAAALYSQGRVKEAFSSYNTALMYDPLNPAVNYNLGALRALRGDYAGAKQQVSEFIDKHPRAPAYMYAMLAYIEGWFGNFIESLRYYNQVKEDSSYPVPIGAYAEAYHNLGLFERMEEWLVANKAVAYSDPAFAPAYRKLLSTQGELDRLGEFTQSLVDHVHSEYGPPDQWPRTWLQALGQNMFALGDYEQAAQYLTGVHGEQGRLVDHQLLINDLDSLHALGYSLKMLGDAHRAESIIDYTLELISTREAQGYNGFPDLTAAKARAYAISGAKAMAVATMRQATAQGWRRYWTIHPGDPRWEAIRGEPDFRVLLADIHSEVNEMRERAEARLVRVD